MMKGVEIDLTTDAHTQALDPIACCRNVSVMNDF